jgi:hypothetical protein
MPVPVPFPTPFPFSQSSLQDYAECPRRFRLRYLDQLAWPAVESEPALENERRQQEGRLFHRLVQQHRLGLPADKLQRLANTPDLQRWWANYLDHPLDLPGHVLYTELSLSAPLAGHRLVAKYDLVAVLLGEKAVIYDWKTYQKRPRDERMVARWQTRLYRWLLVQAGAALNDGRAWLPEQVEMVYWYADHPGEPARFPYQAAQHARDGDLLVKVINEISTAPAYEMTEELERCNYCPYRSYCERGERAGEDRDGEAGLEETDFDFENVHEIPIE